MKKLLGTMLVLGAGSAVAWALPLTEMEDNNSLPSANFVAAASYPFGGVAIDGSLTATPGGPGDVDYYTFSLEAGDRVAVAVFDFVTDNTTGLGGMDTLLGIFAPDGMLFDMDDDDNIGSLSAYQFTVPTTGIWGVAVAGAGDADFDGVGSSVTGDYKLVFAINPTPEPTSLALLALGGVFALRRR
jgi:hypothetical protein